MTTRSPTLVMVFVIVGCKTESPPTRTPPGEPPVALAGVWPEKFECASIASTEVLAGVLGGPTRKLDNPASVPRGVAMPCNYEVTHGGRLEYWMFDFDCRDGMKQRADALFEQYRSQNAELVAQWNHLADAGAIKPNDAGIAAVAPGEAREVAVGAKALDHHGQGLLFIDDDAPCYVRVTGTDQARRLELAKLVARNLTFANAPMAPRRAQ